MTLKALQEQAEELATLTGRAFRVQAQNGVVALVEKNERGGYHIYSQWVERHKELSQRMEFFRRGFEWGRAQATRDTAKSIAAIAGDRVL
jgi:hypothetical protein